jgi:biopolymer transport protein ExbD
MVTPNAIKVALPNSQAKPTIDNMKPIHLAVTKDHKYFINGKEMQKEAIEAELKSLSANMIEPTVLMHLDRELSIQDEIDIMTICYNLKCKTVLATAATKK